jgi:hypothetical protein
MGRFLPRDEAEGSNEPEDGEQSAESTAADSEAGSRDDKSETIDISDTVAPSIGPHTTVTRPAHSQVTHEQSETDAMGLDKRREVVGKSYAPSLARQATMYGIFLAVVVAVVIGGKLLADELDQPPDEVEPEAVWTGNDIPPAPIDSRPAGNIPTEGP